MLLQEVAIYERYLRTSKLEHQKLAPLGPASVRDPGTSDCLSTSCTLLLYRQLRIVSRTKYLILFFRLSFIQKFIIYTKYLRGEKTPRNRNKNQKTKILRSRGKSVRGYVKQMREETGKLKIKRNRGSYGKLTKTEGKQSYAEMMRR